jgi:flavodoxin
MKTIILFYSRTEKTAAVVKTLSKEISADTIEITDLKERSGVLNYMNAIMDAIRENKTDIQPSTVNLNDYGLVYIGTPTWAGKPAPAIITFIDKCDFRGKDVVLFATMGGRGGEKVIERMREKIEARGGRMVTYFLIKTGGKKIDEIMSDMESTINEMDLKIYGI